MSAPESQRGSFPDAGQVTSARAIGHIIHAAYGIGLDGSPQRPSNLRELQRQGYTNKEISFALKAGLFLDTMQSIVPEIQSGIFVPIDAKQHSTIGAKQFSFQTPFDLANDYGRLDMSKVKLYIQGMINTHATRIWNGPFRKAYPNAYAILYELNKKGKEPAEQLQVFDALGTGVDVILASHTFIATHGTDKKLGSSLTASLPVIYHLASQNMDTKSKPALLLEKGLIRGADEEQDHHLQTALETDIKGLPPAVRAVVTDIMLRHYEEIDAKSPRRLAALHDFRDVLFASETKDTAFYYLAGLRSLPPHLSANPAAIRYFDHLFHCMGVNYLNASFAKLGILPQGHVFENLMELERIRDSYSLNPDFFDLSSLSDHRGIQIHIKRANDGDEKRAKELLFRQDIVFEKEKGMFTEIPADLATPRSKTVKCAAMHAVLPAEQQAALQQITDVTGFYPKQINGVSFIVLLDALLTQQFEQAMAA